MAKKEATILNRIIMATLRQQMCRQWRRVMKSAVVPANSPDNVMLSPYVGSMKGKNIITNIPNPKPLARCMKLAAIAKRNMSVRVVGIMGISCAKMNFGATYIG